MDAEVRAQLEAQIARSLGLDGGDSLKPPPAYQGPSSEDVVMVGLGDSAQDDREESDACQEEYDFCLFGGSGANASKVVLEDDTENLGDGGMATRRDLSCFLAPDYSEGQRQMFRAAAVTGDEVVARSHWRAYALEMPWKVTHITVTRKGGQTVPADNDDTGEAKRKRRPGKKRRIAMRTKEREEKEKAQTAAQTAVKKKKQKEQQVKEKEKKDQEKEEHLKDKKKRLNRARKLKRRAKEREKKAGLGVAGEEGATTLTGGGGGGGGGGGDSDDDLSDGSE